MMNTLSMEQNTSESPSESIHHAANAFSTKDTAPGVDELVRKQRVIRYMEEERESGQRRAKSLVMELDGLQA